jgi:flagellar assembly protein FliH
VVGHDIPASNHERCKEAVPSLRSDVAPPASPNSQKIDSAEAAEEAKRNFAAGRDQGIEEGKQLERENQRALSLEIEKRRIEQAAQLADSLAQEREKFLYKLEPEVVKLALSIASRVLRHQAQMDPLFLIGAVRVALGQLAQSSIVRIRVPASDAVPWSETIAQLSDLKMKPTVIGNEKLRPGECFLETDLGVADLGVESQLAEISRELLDSTPIITLQKNAEISPKKQESQ